jgi:hypothetical protein
MSVWGIIFSIIVGIYLFTIEEIFLAVAVIGGTYLFTYFILEPLIKGQEKDWKSRVTLRVQQLAIRRKEMLDERQQFYSSPEWKLLRVRVIREDGRTCTECKTRISNPEDITVDHIKPRSKYPKLALERSNLRVLCRQCNASKGDQELL